jgi:AAA15 family ATPase/GTPase
MKKLIFFFIILYIHGCSKPKTVLICGDHICINKTEARQHFEENLSLEVRIIDKNKSKEQDLVQLNLRSTSEGEKQVNIFNKKSTKKKLKILSNEEIKNKKKQLKERKQNKVEQIKKTNKIKINEKKNVNKNKELKAKVNRKASKKILKLNKDVNKKNRKVVDICTILPKCSIDEISKYLIKVGNAKSFPDITRRE